MAEGVIVRRIGTVIIDAYVAIILVALVFGPLVVLHGYRAWWLVTFYAVVGTATVGGIISRYRVVGRNSSADPGTGTPT